MDDTYVKFKQEMPDGYDKDGKPFWRLISDITKLTFSFDEWLEDYKKNVYLKL